MTLADQFDEDLRDARGTALLFIEWVKQHDPNASCRMNALQTEIHITFTDGSTVGIEQIASGVSAKELN